MYDNACNVDIVTVITPCDLATLEGALTGRATDIAGLDVWLQMKQN